jgi:hypothetical protein
MKLVCTCGIRHFIFDWPAADIKDGGKDMKERHIFCPCQREIVIRTSPKDEIEFDGPDDSKKPKVYSQEALAKAMGLDIPPEVERTNTNMPLANVLVSVTLNADEAALLKDLTAHYGNVFKQPLPIEGELKDGEPPPPDKHQAEREAYIALSEKIVPPTYSVGSADEAKMIRCALSSRNVVKRFPVKGEAWDDDPNVIGKKAASEMRDRIYKELEVANV